MKKNKFLAVLLAMAIALLLTACQVDIPGVGTLHIVRREGGKRRNPRTGEEVEIPPHRVVRFRPSHRPVSRP